MVNKYQRLANHLASLSTSPWKATFAEVEAVMGEALPFSAREHRPWWGNSSANSQSAAWMTVGWKTARVDLAAETVEFHRSDAVGSSGRGVPPERLRELARAFAEPGEDAEPDDALYAVAALLEHADPAEQRVIETLSRVALAGQARRVADALENLEDLLVEYASGQGL